MYTKYPVKCLLKSAGLARVLDEEFKRVTDEAHTLMELLTNLILRSNKYSKVLRDFGQFFNEFQHLVNVVYFVAISTINLF